MKRLALAFLFLFSCALFAVAGEKETFGPVTYDVKERYGLDNVYTGSFSAADGLFIIRLQLGNKIPERPEQLQLTVNGQKVVPDGIL